MTLVTFAVPFESAEFRRRTIIGARVPAMECLHTGVGSEIAGTNLRARLAQKPRVTSVIIAGFAGALDENLAVGDLITCENGETGAPSVPPRVAARVVRLVESPRVLVSVGDKREFRQRGGAEAVDMESETLTMICRERQLPHSILRVISDDAVTEICVPADRLANAARRPILGSLQLGIWLLINPQKWYPFTQFLRNCHRAQKSLAHGLAKLVEHERGNKPEIE